MKSGPRVFGRRLAAASAILALTTGFGIATPQPAHALIRIIDFETIPYAGDLGTQFTFSVDGFGCPSAVGYAIYGPGDMETGDWGPEIATGTLPAETLNADGSSATIGTATITPTQPGSYTIAANGDTGATVCAPGDPIGIAPGTFEVTTPTAPQDALMLTPAQQSQSIDNTATVTATLVSGATGQPIVGTVLTFAETGPNSYVNGSCLPTNCTTDSNGQVVWTYAGTQTGDDTVNAQVGPQGGSGVIGQAAIEWTPTVNGDTYAALGDSYSAGEGLSVYLDGTNSPGLNMCHRSVLAYGPRLDQSQNLGSLGFAACSGAVTDDLFNPNHTPNFTPDGSSEPAQLCQPATFQTIPACGAARLPVIGPDTKTVTLTIGGNDAGFVDIVQSCVWVSLGPGNRGKPGRGCSNDPAIYLPTYRRLDALAGWRSGTSPAGTPIHSLSAVLAAVHTAAPNAQVYIAGYPNLFQDNSHRDCTVGEAIVGGNAFDLRITPRDAQWLDESADLLDAEIAAAARHSGSWATVVDVRSAFKGHGICSNTPWINPIIATAELSDISDPTIDPGSLHPSLDGQVRGYEPAFVAAGLHH